MSHVIGSHVIAGATRKSITGYHSRPGGIDFPGWSVQVLRGPNKKGVYEGEVFFNGVKKKNTGISTFFPDAWDAQRIQKEILAAYMSGKGPGSGTLWEGISSGVKIEGRIDGGVIKTAYPVY